MSEDLEPAPIKSTPSMQRFIIYAVVLFVVFMLGLVPMWLKARASASSLAETERQLTAVRMENTLAAAAIDARRGDYEPARQAASQFFTSLRAEIDKADASAFPKARRDGMQTLFDGRDEIITLLARSDPASADKLSDLYVGFRKVLSG